MKILISSPFELVAGLRVEIVLAKTGRKRWPPRDLQRLDFITICRDGDGWLMHAGAHRPPSRVPDSAPCYRDGRMTLVGVA